MHGIPRLMKRGNIYYFRAKYPEDLVLLAGRREKRLSLRTGNRQKAIQRVRELSVAFDRECALLRHKLEQMQPPRRSVTLNDSTIEEICSLWKASTLAGDEYARQSGLLMEDFDERHQDRLETRTVLRRALAVGDTAVIDSALSTFLHLLGIELLGDTQVRDRLRYRFLQSVTETHELQLARDQGDPIPTPPPPPTSILPEVAEPDTLRSGGAPDFEELFEDWKRFSPRRSPKTIDEMRRALDLFYEIIGRRPASSIERADIVRFRDTLIGRGLHSSTMAKKVGFIGTLFNIGIDHGKLERNPARRIAIPRNDRTSRQPFDLDDLRRIFGCAIYTEGKPLGRRYRYSGAWMPLLALFHGCRLEEIAQLRTDDIQRIDGIDCLIIDDYGAEGDKHLKNSASRRRLPLHPEVIRAGFLEYVQAIRTHGHERLFPELQSGAYGRYSDGFSKAFRYLLRNKLGITDRRKVFHSFRHTFRTACREAGLDEEIADALMGHSNSQRIGRRYGHGFSLPRLHEAISRIHYPGLHIPPQAPPGEDWWPPAPERRRRRQRRRQTRKGS